MLVTLASPHRSIQPGDDEPFSSPLFREVMTRFDRTTRRVILEPGSISPGILQILQGQRCRLLVADAALALSDLSGKTEDPHALFHQLETLIPGAGSEKIDTVFCWDLLNYLTLPQFKVFTARLATIMSPGGMLHAYIHSSQNTMAQRPQRYSVLAEDRILRLDQDPAERKTPRYSYGDLDKHASGFCVARSMLLRNGLQEYLLRLNQI
jgi:hypothetical protein